MASNPNHEMPTSEKITWAITFGVPAIFVLGFAVYWFGIRDSWELDNQALILEKCKAIQTAVEQSDDDTATREYDELEQFMGDRTVEDKSLAGAVAKSRKEIVPVKNRIEQALAAKAAQERAESERRQAELAGQRRLEAEQERQRELADAKPTYKGFTESELERLYARLRSQGYDSENAILTVQAMLEYPDTRAKCRRWLDSN